MLRTTNTSKVISLAIVIVMLIGLIPISSFANQESTKNVVQIYTDDLDETIEVPVGTAKKELDLPSELKVKIEEKVAVEQSTADSDSAAEETDSKNVQAEQLVEKEETVKVNWDGEYDQDKAGEYKMTASFADSSYVYSKQMPQVTVKVVKADSDKSSGHGIMTLASSGSSDDGIMLTALQEVNILPNVTSQSFKVKYGTNDYTEYDQIPEDAVIHIGDEVWAQFKYAELTDVTPEKEYYFAIPEGLTPLTGSSNEGPIKDDSGKSIGKYWVDDGKIKLQFDNLSSTDNTVKSGYVNFYAALNSDAVKNNGDITLNNKVIGHVNIVDDEEVANVKVLKWNGGLYGGITTNDKLDFNAAEHLVKYSICARASEDNTVAIKDLNVVDTLTVTPSNVLNGSDYQDIVISTKPAEAINDINASFTKGGDGRYTLHASNVQSGTEVYVTYYVPVKEDTFKADFKNTAELVTNDQVKLPSSDSVTGNINTTLQINKSSTTPQFNTETGETTVTYKVKVTAPSSNSVDIANAYVEDTFVTGGDAVKSVSNVTSSTAGVSGGGDLETINGVLGFKVQLGTMKPGQTIEYTYVATLDTKKCYFPEKPSDKELKNTATAKNSDNTFDKADAKNVFSRENTVKKGAYDPTKGLFKYTVTFNGMLPGATDETAASSYYDGALKSFDDIITTNGFTFAASPAPHLEAYRGDNVIKDTYITKDEDGKDIAGQSNVSVPIPSDMRGQYSYRLTYYVKAPAGYEYVEGDTVKNTFKSVTSGMIGTDNPESTDLVFTTESSTSAATSVNLNLSKATDGKVVGVAGEDGYAVQGYKIEITSPIYKDAEVKDWITVEDGSLATVKFPIDFLRDNLSINMGTKELVAGTEYRLEEANDPAGSFKITFLKDLPEVNDSNNKITISYKGQVVATDTGKTVGAEANGLKNNQTSRNITNHAELSMGEGLTSGDKTAAIAPTAKIEKKAATKEILGFTSGINWDIVLTDGASSLFGEGNHTLVDELPDYLEVVEVQQYEKKADVAGVDIIFPSAASVVPKNTGSGTYWTVDGNNVTIHNAASGSAGMVYRIVTKIKPTAVLTDEDGNKINPDNFENFTVDNKVYYEAIGAKWYASDSQTTSLKRNTKDASYSGAKLTFTLDINKDGADLDANKDTLTIHDTMNKELSLKPETLLINGKKIDDESFGGKVKLTYKEGSNTFDLVVPDGMYCKITYEANIDAEVGEKGWATNTAEIEGRAGTVSFENKEWSRAQLGAGVTLEKSFYLKKTDENNKLLPGASFTLTKVELREGIITKVGDAIESVDGADGTYKLKGAGIDDKAVYVLEETAAPEGYIKDSQVHYIAFSTVSADLKAAIEKDSNATLTEDAHTGGGNNVDTMFKVINKEKTKDIDVSVSKTWDDNNDQDDKRPTSAIKVQLYKTVGNTTSEVGDPVTLTEKAGKLAYTFTALPAEDGNQTITYSVKELKADGSDVVGTDNQFNDDYTVSYEGDMTTGLIVKNSHTPETVNIPVTKKWIDNGDQLKKRPTEITVKVKNGNEVVKSAVVKADEDGNWKYDFKDLPKYAGGQEIQYTVEEDAVSGYNTPAITGNIKDGFTITNTYSVPTESSVPFIGSKTLTEGGNPKAITAGQFKFTATEDEGNPAAITGFPEGQLSVGTDGSFSLGTLGFTKAGTYKFTVSEVNSGAAGYTYDNKPVTVTVPVTLDTATNKLVVGTVSYQKDGNAAEGIKFANTYTTPTGASQPFTGSKTLTEGGNPKTITAGQFKFTATEDESNPAAITGFPEGQLSVGTDGSFSLGTLGFTKAGTYKFTVSEVNSGAAGYTYDNKPVTVTVPVTLDTATNKLVVGTVSYQKDGNAAEGIKFANTYTTPTGSSVPFTGSKTLTEGGNPKAITAGQFKFTATEDKDNPAAITGFPEGQLSVGTDGSFALGTMNFTKAGTYKFTVSEVNSGAAGYTYDNKPVTVTVPVTLDTATNKLVVGTVSYQKDGNAAEGITFANTYTTPTGSSVPFTGSKTLTEGGNPKAIKAGQFKFTATEDESNPAAITGFPEGQLSVGADGTFSLGTMNFTKAGTYKFTVSEVNSGAAGYTYDNKPVTVTVPVTLDTATNKLVVGTVSYQKDGNAAEGIKFANTYATPEGGSQPFTGNKTLTENGNPKAIKAGQFKFTATEDKDNPAAITGFPEGQLSVGTDGRFALGTLEFTKAGTYKFTVAEEDSGATGYTYDNKPVTVTVPVTLDTATNKLVVGTIDYQKNGEPVDGIVFANKYETPKEASQPFTASKLLTENDEDKAIREGQFKFTATEDKDNPAAITGFPEGQLSVGTDGQFSLGTMNFTKAGTYKFTVSEINSGAAGYTYDDKDVTATVNVVLNENTNELEIDGVEYQKDGEPVDGIVFANKYETPAAAKQPFIGNKTLTENGKAKAIKEGQFKFNVTESQDNPAAITDLPDKAVPVKADGTFSLGTLEFTKAGTYSFTVSEVDGKAYGYTYDNKPVTVTVSVVLNEETNELEVQKIEYSKDGKDAAQMNFANQYSPDATVLKLPVEKVIKGGTPSLKEDFLFELEAEDGAPMPKKDAIKIRGEGKSSFGEIKFKEAGTYKYTVREIPGNTIYYTYDGTVYDVVVTVTDDDGALIAEWKANGKKMDYVKFVNKYNEKQDPKYFKHKDPKGGKKTSTRAETGKEKGKEKGNKPYGSTATRTGDVSNPVMWLILLILTSIAMLGIVVVKTRRKRDA